MDKAPKKARPSKNRKIIIYGLAVLCVLLNLQNLSTLRLLTESKGAIDKSFGPILLLATGNDVILNYRHRNFKTHPVTSEEDRLLSQRDTFNITAAVCHPTIHGNITSMERFFAFVSYYRLLGFDHVFMWYLKDSVTTSSTVWEDFNRLANLSYVTMTEFVDGGRNVKYYGQSEVPTVCVSRPEFASLYNWTIVVDADEYLWFKTKLTIKTFLSQHNYTYYSFAKWQYSPRAAISLSEHEDSGFGLDRYAFTPGMYCYQGLGKETYCPDWLGRCKILAHPSLHKASHPHGDHYVLKRFPTSVHYDPQQAHINEWPGFVQVEESNVTIRDPVTFLAKTNDEVGVHFLERSYTRFDNGTTPVAYDEKLSIWTKYVASNLPN